MDMEHIEITAEMLDRAETMFYNVEGSDPSSFYSPRDKVWHILKAAIVHESEDDMTYSPSLSW